MLAATEWPAPAGHFSVDLEVLYEATAARARSLGITDIPLSLSNRRLIDCEHGPQSQKCSSLRTGFRAVTRNGVGLASLKTSALALSCELGGGVASTSTRKIFPSRR